MSQLDNKIKNKAKKTFYMLLIFAVICSGITVALIYSTLTLKKEKTIQEQNLIVVDKQEESTKQATIKKIKLTDKYYTNGITVEERKISVGDIVYQYEDTIHRKLDINYIQISGLKNTKIQEKINKEIENKVLSLRNEDELNDPEIERIGIYAYISGNFADVLSVNIYKDISRKNGEEYDFEYLYDGLNYSLKDGERIKFKSLFTEDASIKNIITQAIYDSLAWEYAQESGNMDADMNNVEYGTIEDKIFKFLSKYTQNPDISFYFSPATISIIDGEKIHSIEMAKFYESIAIYSRYKSKTNLYENKEKSNNINYVFSTIDMSEFTVEETNKTDNFHYRILKYYMMENETETTRKAEENVKELVYKKINEYAILANKNKEKGYVLDIIYGVSDYDGKISYNYHGYLCSMDRKFYNNSFEEVLAASRREEMVELWAIDYSWQDKENIRFEEEASIYVEDFNNPIEIEKIVTKEEREAEYGF